MQVRRRAYNLLYTHDHQIGGVRVDNQGAPCPNCGESMTRYRIERVPASRYEAELEWSICSTCRHVRLEHWNLHKPDDAAAENRRSSPGTRHADGPRCTTP